MNKSDEDALADLKNRAIRGVMCAVGWRYELGDASDGNRIFPNVECLLAHCPECETCGLVEVEVKFVRVAKPGKYTDDL